jgi:hypothetical protein
MPSARQCGSMRNAGCIGFAPIAAGIRLCSPALIQQSVGVVRHQPE